MSDVTPAKAASIANDHHELARAFLVAFPNVHAQIDLGNRLAMMDPQIARLAAENVALRLQLQEVERWRKFHQDKALDDYWKRKALALAAQVEAVRAVLNTPLKPEHEWPADKQLVALRYRLSRALATEGAEQ